MKNNLSISLLAVLLSCSLGFSAFAVDTENFEGDNNEEISTHELMRIENECIEIGTESGMENEELEAFKTECIAVNTMYTTDGSDLLATEDTQMEEEVFPADIEEAPMEGEEVFPPDFEETSMEEEVLLDENGLPVEDSAG